MHASRESRAHRIAAALALLAAGAIAACGEDSGERPPAAGPYTPGSGTPGVPAGAPYDVDGRQWLDLGQRARFEATEAFIEDNPERCDGADVGAVAFYATNSFGTDFPLDVPAADALAEGCDASLQS